MKLFKFWYLFTSDKIKPGHKRYILWALSIMSLEYLDIIVYIHNSNELANLYLKTQSERFLGLGVLLLILWLSNFIGKMAANKLFPYLSSFFYNRIGLTISSIAISISFLIQAWIILTLCHKAFFYALSLYFVIRLCYQICINLVMRDTYEAILTMDDVSGEFITLIVNSLELSLLIGVIGYKIIAWFPLRYVNSLMVFVFLIAAAWMMAGIVVLISNIKNTSQSNDRSSLGSFYTIYSSHPKDSLIAVGIVGIRSSLCIIGVIFMPTYLVQTMHLNAQVASNIISISSLVALILNIWINQHLHKFDFTSIVKYGLTGVIMGSFICYILFLFQIIPLLAVMIIVVFHGFFAVASPMLLNNLFNPETRQLAVISCYRNSFFLFSTFSYLFLIFFTQLLHSVVFPPAVFLIIIAGVCYLSMILFNRQ